MCDNIMRLYDCSEDWRRVEGPVGTQKIKWFSLPLRTYVIRIM